MANHKSAAKAHKKSVEKKHRNTSILSKIKTFIKNVESMLSSGDSKGAAEAARKAESVIMKSVSKGALKKNTAARKVSKMTQKVKKASSK